jgi:hypothetical protein
MVRHLLLLTVLSCWRQQQRAVQRRLLLALPLAGSCLN